MACRGKYDGPEAARLAALRLAATSGFAYVDVELKIAPVFFAGEPQSDGSSSTGRRACSKGTGRAIPFRPLPCYLIPNQNAQHASLPIPLPHLHAVPVHLALPCSQGRGSHQHQDHCILPRLPADRQRGRPAGACGGKQSAQRSGPLRCAAAAALLLLLLNGVALQLLPLACLAARPQPQL